MTTLAGVAGRDRAISRATMRPNWQFVFAYLVLAIAAVMFALPFFWLVTTAFKPDAEIFASPLIGFRPRSFLITS